MNQVNICVNKVNICVNQVNICVNQVHVLDILLIICLYCCNTGSKVS